MAMEIGPNIVELNQFGKFFDELATIFSKLRWNPREIECLVDRLFACSSDLFWRLVIMLFKEAVFAQSLSAINGALSHHHVVFL